MSTKKTTIAKAPAKTAAMAKPEAKPAAKKEAVPKAQPATKPTAKPVELTPFAKLFEGLPKNPKECTAEQVKALQTAYAKVKAELTEAEQGKVREYGVTATNHLKSAAKPAAKAEVTDKEIQNLINEMNKVMDLEPIIVFGDDHMNRITTEAKDLREQDFDCSRPTCFTTEATKTFRKLGIALPGEKAAAKTAKAKAPKVPGEKRTPGGVGRSAFGHQLTSQAGLIDTALVKGASMDDLVKVSGAAAQRVAAHMAHLKSAHGASVEKSDKGIYKLSA